MIKLRSRAGRFALRAGCVSMLVAVLSLGLFVGTASATTMKYAGMDRLIEISDIIVYAKVTDRNTYFDKARGRVVTDTTLKVKRAFYGWVGDTVTIQQFGGTYAGKTHIIPGDAHFDDGEDVIVFLHRAQNVVALSALSQAKYSVHKNGSTRMVTRDLSDITFLLDQSAPPKLGKLPAETTSFASFVAELQTAVAAVKGEPFRGGNRE